MSAHNFSDLGVAIVGAGLMGRWHAHAANRLGAQVKAIVDSDPVASESLAKQYAGAVSYSSVTQLLQITELDALHVCTPPATHQALVSEALDSGVHVLVEKPVTPAAAETKALLQQAKEQGVVLCPVHQFAFQRGVDNTVEALASLGDVLRVSFRTHSAGADGKTPEVADEVVADILPHPLSVLQRLFPDCLAQASEWQSLRVCAGELQVSARVGTFGLNIDISMHARPTRCEMDIACERGRVYLNFFHGYAIVEPGRVGRFQKMIQPVKYAARECLVSSTNLASRLIRNEPAYPGLRNLVKAFYLAIQKGEEGPVTPADVLSLAELRDRLIRDSLPADCCQAAGT